MKKNGELLIVDLETKEITHKTKHNTKVSAVLFNSDSTILAFGLGRGTVGFMDAERFVELAEPSSMHRSSVTDLSFSENEKKLFSTSLDSNFVVWDVGTFKKISRKESKLFFLIKG